MKCYKKDFEQIAEIINKSRFDDPLEDFGRELHINGDLLINKFCEFLKTTNKEFDEKKFVEACLK